MAVSIAQLEAITHKYVRPKLADNIFDPCPLLKKIMETDSFKSVDGGTTIDEPLNYADAGGDWYQGADTLATADVENMSAARYSWKSAFAPITISEEDELKNSGNAQILNLVKTKTEIAQKTMKNILGTGIFSDGTTAKSIVGLRDIVDTASTVGGISQTDNSWWSAGSVDSTTITNSISAMNAVFQECVVGSEQPNMIVSTRAIWNSYYALLQPQQRFQDSKTADGGFQNLLFNGQVFVFSNFCPTSNLFMLNLNSIFLYYHPERKFSQEKWAKPINQQVKVSRILFMGAMGSNNCRLNGRMSALTA
jgi:hypothetical protein